MHILMAASENDGIRGGKVGVIGDVLRDLPSALAEQGHRVTVVTPSYGFLHKINPIIGNISILFHFKGRQHRTDIFEVSGKRQQENVTHMVFDAPYFADDPPRIYSADPPHLPFAADAIKFACFNTALAEAIKWKLLGELDVIHLHDWHAAFLVILREYHAAYAVLKNIRTVYSIHNLAYQGVRPFSDHPSSLTAWYPDMAYAYGKLADPRWSDSFNPMAAGVRLADAVNTVSPSYAEEIARPSIREENHVFYGGEGLDRDIAAAQAEGRFFGILNGCDYPESREGPPGFVEFLHILKSRVRRWMGSRDTVPTDHVLAYTGLQDLEIGGRRPDIILTSVGRLSEQKLRLMRQGSDRYESGLQGILDCLGDQGLFILLGTGDDAYKEFLIRMAAHCDNFLFLRGYSATAAEALYRSGDLFLMPSSFEPCGISQMLAMREGQPCLAHAVGGLKDTVLDGVDGFTFAGETTHEQVNGLVDACRRAVDLRMNHPEEWNRIRRGAGQAVFSWADTARNYTDLLYRPDSPSPPPR